MSQVKVFDAHFHIGRYGDQTAHGRAIQPIAQDDEHSNADACIRYLDRHGIRGGVILPTYLDDQQAAFRYNDLVLNAVTRDERLLGGLWVSPLPSLQRNLDQALRALPNDRIRALKIASNTWQECTIDPRTWSKQVRINMERILDAARAHQMVIHCHTGYAPGAEPQAFEPFMQRYGPAATYQLVHMGEVINSVFAFVPRFIDWVRRGFDVYTDISLVPGFGPSWILRELEANGLSLKRLLFATDAPWGNFDAAYHKLSSLGLPPFKLSMVLWENAAKLYRFES